MCARSNNRIFKFQLTLIYMYNEDVSEILRLHRRRRLAQQLNHLHFEKFREWFKKQENMIVPSILSFVLLLSISSWITIVSRVM
uniref:Putative ovule protein n=1 Tax=Solanum chacoense TaxID=4108 RepID=A0A0V0GJ77_SOLCH